MSELKFRKADEDDLPAIVAMLDDDGLGRGRERPLSSGVDPVYVRALQEVQEQAGNHIMIVERDGEPVGTYQIAVIAGLSRYGTRRAQIEAVRVKSGKRGGGIGEAMLRHAIAQARQEGCQLVQLSSDRRRGRAHLFYERLGFVATHIGFKLELK